MEEIKFQPIGNTVLVKAEPEEERKIGGIILPDTAKNQLTKAVVKVLGDGELDEKGNPHKFHVAVNDVVVIRSYVADNNNNKIKINETEYLLINEADILGILK